MKNWGQDFQNTTFEGLTFFYVDITEELNSPSSLGQKSNDVITSPVVERISSKEDFNQLA